SFEHEPLAEPFTRIAFAPADLDPRETEELPIAARDRDAACVLAYRPRPQGACRSGVLRPPDEDLLAAGERERARIRLRHGAREVAHVLRGLPPVDPPVLGPASSEDRRLGLELLPARRGALDDGDRAALEHALRGDGDAREEVRGRVVVVDRKGLLVD